MLVILSIKPKYCNRIASGKKKYEFRKRIPKHWDEVRFLVYSSSPIKKIIGEFSSSKVISASPEEVWELCQSDAGISSEEFFAYFKGRTNAYAIQIDEFVEYDPIDPIVAFNEFCPPQSYQYLTYNHLFSSSQIPANESK